MPTANLILQQGRYRVIRPLGRDETGATFQAYDNVLAADIVIKELAPDSRQFITEDSPASSRRKDPVNDIKHPVIAGDRDFFSENERRYLVTEAIDGNALSDLLDQRKRPFALGEVMKWADDLLDALQYLHTRDPAIVHGEIKPQNLIMSPDGAVKLLSFQTSADSLRKTGAGSSCITASPYTPLEQIWNGLDTTSQTVILKSYDERSERILEQPLDERSDLYSLGATVYHLLAARPPVDALERSIDILDGKPDPLQPLSLINPEVPSEVSDVLMKVLEIKRELRFSSAVIMRQILRTALVRVRERKSQDAKKQQDAALENKRAEQQRAEEEKAAQALRLAEQTRIETEAEEKRQTELVKQQLREAESRRLAAERRAAEAERRLSEIELEKSAVETAPADENKPLPIPASAPKTIALEPAKRLSDADEAGMGLLGSYAEPQKENKIFRRLAAFAVALFVLGGAAWGVLSFIGTKTPEPQPAMLYEQPQPAPTAETVSAPVAEPTPEVKPEPSASPSPELMQAADRPPVSKDRPLPAPRRAKKQTAPATRPPAQKKTVTVDDLINDN